MDIVKDRPEISLEEFDQLSKELYGLGFLPNEYLMEREIKLTTVKCPICGKNVITNACGNSYEITCETDGCIREGIRGV